MGGTDNAEIQKTSEQSIFPKIEKLVSDPNTDSRESQIKSFINNRLSELSSNAPTILSLGTQKQKPYVGLINPASLFKPAITHEGIKINDSQIYTSLLEAFFYLKDNPAWQDSSKKEKTLALSAVQLAVDTYFGYNGKDTSAKRWKFYDDHTPDFGSESAQKGIDLIEMKGKGIAQCSEKAAVAQNLLTFLGYDSELIISQCGISGEEEENHAYNVVKIKGNRYIYDPTNPVIIERQDGSIYYTPANYPLTEDQYNSLTTDHQIEVIHNNQGVENGSLSKKPDIKRVYGGIGG